MNTSACTGCAHPQHHGRCDNCWCMGITPPIPGRVTIYLAKGV